MIISLKMIMLLASFLVVTIELSFSQSDVSVDKENKSASEYLQIGFINETALYYHNSLTERILLKSGVSIFWNYDEKNEGEGYWKNQYNPTPEREEKTKSNGIENKYEIILSSLAMYSINDHQYAKMYFGFGPSLSYSLIKYSGGNSNFTDTTYSRNGDESNYSVFGIGPSVSALIKSHLYANLFLVSEYNIIAHYTWNTENYNSRYESKYAGSSPNYSVSQRHEESNGWKLRLSNVRVGLLIAL